jgi:hypothetical protein
MGNPIEGLRGSVGGCRRRPAASGGPVSSVRSCGHGEAREREKNSGRASSPPREASGALVHRAGATERQRGEISRCSNGSGGASARMLGFRAAKAATAGWGG